MSNEWTDGFGDKLTIREVGAVVQVGIVTEVDDPCVELDFDQQRELADWLNEHLRKCGR